MTPSRLTRIATLTLALLSGALGPLQSARATDAPDTVPVPADYRDWIFLSSGIDMSYTEKPDMRGHSMFDNVFVNPEAYRDFKQTGTWPEHTVLVLEVRGAATKGSINQHGKFQTAAVMAVELHIKDTARFATGWAFFASNGSAPAAKIPESAECYACHQKHAAVDTTFVQFYPTLFGLAKEKGTLAPAYLP